MGVEAVLERARTLGVRLSVEGEYLLYQPKSATPPDFVEVLRQHKPSIMAHLRYRQKYPGDGPPGDAELREIEDRVLSEGYCLLWSTVLEDFMAFYRDEDDKAKIPPGFVHYSLQELERLFGDGTKVAVSTLRLIHQAKKLGGGTVISSEGQP